MKETFTEKILSRLPITCLYSKKNTKTHNDLPNDENTVSRHFLLL